MEKKIITPVGLSLFTNFFKGEDEGGGDCEGLEDYYESLKNSRSATKYDERDIKDARDILKPEIQEWATNTKNACAELTSIRKIQGEFPNDEFKVYLLPSDTVVSKFAAEIISEDEVWEKQLNRVNEVIAEPYIEGLQVENEQNFIQKGMKFLIEKIDDFVKSYPMNLVLNITGGYKATIPYITIMGQIYNVPLYYTFEESEEISTQPIRIPQTPIDINMGLFEKYSHLFKQLEAGVYDWKKFRKIYSYEADELLVHSCVDIFKINGEEVAELSPVGKMFWNRYNNFYPVKVLAGSNYFNETDKTNLNRTIQELCRRLKIIFSDNKNDEIESHFLQMHDKDVKHVRIGSNKFSQVYKHSNPQIRLHYIIEFSDAGYSLKIINFRHRKDNSDYARELTNDYNSITDHRYTTIAIHK